MIFVWCIDRNYKDLARVSIATYKKNNPEAKFIIVSEESITGIGEDENVIIKLPKVFRNRGNGDRITNTAYLRLFLTDLPYDKVLYIDADTVCQKPLDDLWKEDIEYIGVTESHLYGEKQAKELGIKKYVLSGFMLMNLKNLREINFKEESIEAIDKVPELKCGFCHKESVLNWRWNDKLTFLPLRYHICHNREYREQIPENNASILHYVGKEKGEMLKCFHYPELMALEEEIKGKRVAIVGNAKSIFDKKYGKEIDNHDFIIRFNRGFIQKAESQGNKTSLLILACPLTDDEIKKFDTKWVANRSESYTSNADFTINNYDRWLIANSLGSQPSTGFMAVNICLYYKAKEIDLYGFDFCESPTFYNPPDHICPHDMWKEKQILQGYENVGLVKIKRSV